MEFDIHRRMAYVQNLPYFKRRMEIARRTKPPLSRYLYKYRTVDETNDVSVERLRDLLVRSRLWLSSPTDFNDPFDMTGRIVATATAKERLERVKTIIKEQNLPYKEQERKKRMIMRKPVEAFEKELDAIFSRKAAEAGVYSFAGDPRSILMWSHYASAHTGVCVQFERARDFAIFSGAISVHYSPEYPEVNWVKDFEKSLSKFLLSKYEGWSYERECRIIRPGDAHTYLHFDPSAVVAIILGCRSNKDLRKAIKSLFEERFRAGMPSVRLFAAQKHRSEYHLVISAAM